MHCKLKAAKQLAFAHRNRKTKSSKLQKVIVEGTTICITSSEHCYGNSACNGFKGKKHQKP